VQATKEGGENIETLGAGLPKWLTIRFLVRAIGSVLIVYLSWRILAPFLAAISWAFALAVTLDPVYRRLASRARFPNALAGMTVVLVALIVIAPLALLTTTVTREATDAANRLASDANRDGVWAKLENSRVVGSLALLLGEQFDLRASVAEVAKFVAGRVSTLLSATLTGSVWLFTQVGVTLYILFYFLRDGEAIVTKLRASLPLPVAEVDHLFRRISQILRVSLGGKVVVAFAQGFLGGLMFYWLDISAPVFWGFVMGVLSLLPVIGAFLVWGPVAIMFALQGNWKDAFIMAGWGALVVGTIDNFLGPILVGTQLRLHTLLTFFTVIGGIAAFGPAGLVLGPVTVAVAVTLAEWAQNQEAG
jgi:predicted PurR-regulated permease PerM